MAQEPVIVVCDTLSKADEFLTLLDMHKITEDQTPTAYYAAWGHDDGSNWATIHSNIDGLDQPYTVRVFPEYIKES
jgi:hypothetical protein